MSGNVALTPAELEAASKMALAVKDDLVQESKALSSQLEGTLADWSGQGKTAFVSVIEGWHEKVVKMAQTLGQLGENFSEVGRVSQAADEENKAGMNKFASLNAN